LDITINFYTLYTPPGSASLSLSLFLSTKKKSKTQVRNIKKNQTLTSKHDS
jgi:hypothetical protein